MTHVYRYVYPPILVITNNCVDTRICPHMRHRKMQRCNITVENSKMDRSAQMQFGSTTLNNPVPKVATKQTDNFIFLYKKLCLFFFFLYDRY